MAQIIQLIDSNTKENVNYEEVTIWHDGTPMDDSKVDNVIYRKKTDKYFVRSFSNSHIDIAWFGAKCDNTTDDTNALQAAMNMAILLDKSIYVPGMAKINGTIVINRPVHYPRIPITIYSNSGGGFTKANAGFVFTGADENTSDFIFKGLKLNIHNPAKFIDASKLITIELCECSSWGTGTIMDAGNRWLQTCKVHDNLFRWGQDPLFRAAYTFDCTFDRNTVESSSHCFIENLIEETPTFSQNNVNLRITNNCFQSLKTTAIRLGICNSSIIKGNYFELNDTDDSQSYINVGLDPRKGHKSLEISNIIVDAKQTQKINLYTAINWGLGGRNCKSFQIRTNLSAVHAAHGLREMATLDIDFLNYRIISEQDVSESGNLSFNNVGVCVDANFRTVGRHLNSNVYQDNIIKRTFNQECTGNLTYLSARLNPRSKYISIQMEIKSSVDTTVRLKSITQNISFISPSEYMIKTTPEYRKVVMEALEIKIVDSINLLMEMSLLPSEGNITIKNLKIQEGTYCTTPHEYELPELRTGGTELRPLVSKGFNYFDSTINKPLVNKGTLESPVWIESDGAIAGVLRTGTFDQKPAASNIYVGYRYFCTDRQTIEGVTNGIEIIHKGNGVWVDALGRVVS